ncbi:MAG: ABC transporter substrate-binding protein [Bacteroidia bacterium]|nr:ABC transporter substrate-binding protein [Bacteroidia bacterium]
MIFGKRNLLFLSKILLLGIYLISCKRTDLKAIEDAPLLTIRFKDDIQQEIVLSKPPLRIISFSAQLTEVFVALGLTDQLVAVSDSYRGNLPESVVRFTPGNIQAEAELTTLNPDCVVYGLSSFLPDEKPNIGFWKRQNIPVITLQIEHLDNVWGNIQKIGTLTAKIQEAKVLQDSLQNIWKGITLQTKELVRYSVIGLFSIEPLGALGKNHWLVEQLPNLGGRPANENIHGSFTAIQADSLLKWNPEYLLILASNDQFLANLISTYPVLDNLQAVEKKQFFQFLPTTTLVPSISSISTLVQIAQSLHTQVSLSNKKHP